MPRDSDARLNPEEVWQAHGQDLQRFLATVIRDAEQASEISQTVFVRLVENIDSINHSTVRGWLFRVGFREALQIRRKAQRRRRLVKKLAVRTETAEESPATAAERRELQVEVRRAIERLPAIQREVVERRIMQESTFSEIAADLKVPLGTVLSRMHSAVKKLALWLGNEDRK